MMAVRAAFDPDWILNPSKVFPLEGRGEGDGGEPLTAPLGDAAPMEAAQ